ICLPIGAYVRGEVFRDQGGFRTGPNQTLWEVTDTGKYFISDKVVSWLEYRHDGSDESVFTKSGEIVSTDPTTGDTVVTFPTRDYQDTIAIAASYVFWSRAGCMVVGRSRSHAGVSRRRPTSPGPASGESTPRIV